MATAYMNLTLPVVGPLGTQGPDWANQVNAALNQIDSHDHSSGKGKQITPSGININQTFSLNSNQLAEVASIALDNLGTQPTAANLIYEFGGELFYNDINGAQVQITSGGAINISSIGTITGDYSTSSADLTYIDAAKTFIFKQNATTTAEVNCGPIKIYRNTPGSPYAQIQQDATQAGNIDWTLPPSYPASTLPIKASSSGALLITQIVAADIATDAVETAKIKDLNVTTGKLADQSVTAAKLANNTITASQIANGTITATQISSVANIAGSQIANDPSFTGTVNATTNMTVNSKSVVTGSAALAIIRGTLRGAENPFLTPPTILAGEGFTAPVQSGIGQIINFTTAFSATPTVVATMGSSTYQNIKIESVSTTSCRINLSVTDAVFHFIAIGPR